MKQESLVVAIMSLIVLTVLFFVVRAFISLILAHWIVVAIFVLVLACVGFFFLISED
jgi:hypothetical protein